MTEFPRVPLSQVAAPRANSFVDGPFGSEMKSAEYAETGVRLIQLQNIGDGEWLDANRKFVSDKKFLHLQRHGAVPGDLAIAKMAAPVARCCVIPPVADRFMVVADCIKLSTDGELYDAAYVARAINSHSTRKEAEQKSSGTTRLRINLSLLKTVSIPSPELSEQVRISQVLDAVDEAIAKSEAVVSKLKQVRAGLLHDLLTRGLDEHGQLRDPIAHPEQFQNSHLGRIPRDWDVSLLDSVAVRGSGHTPSKDVPSYWNGGVKWVSLADSERLDRVYISETDKEISDLGIAHSSAVKHPAGTVILSRDAGVGKSAIIADEMAVSQHFIAWRCGERLNGLYFYYWLQYHKPRFEAIAMGSTIKTIGLPFFKRLEIAVPPRPEQDTVGDLLFSLEGVVSKAERELAKERMLKSGLMADLLTGRVRVPLKPATCGSQP